MITDHSYVIVCRHFTRYLRGGFVIGGERFFDEERQPAFKRRSFNFAVRERRHANVERVQLFAVKHLTKILVSLRTGESGEFLRTVKRLVGKSCDVHVGKVA